MGVTIMLIKKSIGNVKNTNRKKNIFLQLITIFLTIILISGTYIFIPTVKADPADPWWNTNWGYRKEITIDHTKVTADLINFPVLISVDADNDLKNKAQADADDIQTMSRCRSFPRRRADPRTDRDFRWHSPSRNDHRR